MLEREARRQGYSLSQLLPKDWPEAVWRKYGFNSVKHVCCTGYGGITTNQILFRLIDEYRRQIRERVEELDAKDVKPQKIHTANDKGVKVKGIENIMVRFSKCCNPVPGDDIIDILPEAEEYPFTGLIV